MTVDTSAEAVERILYQARYCPSLTDADWEEWRATLRALTAERDTLAAERDALVKWAALGDTRHD